MRETAGAKADLTGERPPAGGVVGVPRKSGVADGRRRPEPTTELAGGDLPLIGQHQLGSDGNTGV